jgi:demethylmenaquinone methyltransferase / 2-methoxy-6-polyprenyl-1,4-benzoquinol methylase
MTPKGGAAGPPAATGAMGELPTPGHPEPAAVRTMFSGIAHRYDLLNLVLSLGQERRWRRRAAQLTRARPGDRVLDACTGTGRLAAVLKRRVGAQGQVVGLDLTEAMLARARRRYAGVEFVMGDACHLPFDDDSFEAATMGFGLRNIDHHELALAELRRVLKPGGRAVILEFSQVSRTLRPWYSAYNRTMIPLVARALLGKASAYQYLTDSISAFPPPLVVTRWLREAGFDRAHYQRMAFGIVAIHIGVKPRR